MKNLLKKLNEPYTPTNFEWFGTHLIILIVAIMAGATGG